MSISNPKKRKYPFPSNNRQYSANPCPYIAFTYNLHFIRCRLSCFERDPEHGLSIRGSRAYLPAVIFHYILCYRQTKAEPAFERSPSFISAGWCSLAASSSRSITRSFIRSASDLMFLSHLVSDESSSSASLLAIITDSDDQPGKQHYKEHRQRRQFPQSPVWFIGKLGIQWR